ncbi:MAG TPA: hypothetical protein ENG23_00920, partial [Methanomicrobia archaeon]|nr:hypothetical protein [Methanomicrobia archaeon]
GVCGSCGGYFKGKERTTVEEAVADSVRRAVRKRFGCVCVVEVSEGEAAVGAGAAGTREAGTRAAGAGAVAFVSVKAELRGVEVEESREVEVIFKNETCERCSRIAGGYYAGIVQIRAEERVPTDEELATAEEIAYSALGEADFVSKETVLKEGLDFYVSSAESGRRISKQVVKRLGGGFSESRRLYGRRDGKNIYRVSFSVRLPGFKEAEVVKIGEREFSIEKVRKGKGLECVGVSTGERVFVRKSETKTVKRV